MKILLDHNVPHGLRRSLEEHDAQTAEYRGWETLRNGELLSAAAAEDFELLITCDQNIRFQQDLSTQPVMVITLSTNIWRIVRPNIPLIRQQIEQATRGSGNFLRLGPER